MRGKRERQSKRAARPLRGAGGASGERGYAAREPHGMAVLGVAHELGRDRMLATQWAAQLADDPLNTGVQMDVLAHQRRASAVRAAIPIGLQSPYAASQLQALELLDVMLGGASHARLSSPAGPCSCRVAGGGSVEGRLMPRFYRPAHG